jgi:hypothetical protein
MNNNTKAKFKRLSKTQRRELGKAGSFRKSKFPKVARKMKQEFKEDTA